MLACSLITAKMNIFLFLHLQKSDFLSCNTKAVMKRIIMVKRNSLRRTRLQQMLEGDDKIKGDGEKGGV